MIPEAEIRRVAAQLFVDPMIIDLDYSLGWFLLGLTKTEDLGAILRFKGGTCLRKCYFPDYRFSEDLDFTAVKHLSSEAIELWINRAAIWIADHDGPDFRVEPIRFEIVDDEYGSEFYQARIYYRGPLRWGGSPRTVRMDVTRHEQLLLPPTHKPLHHPYSDEIFFRGIEVTCYSLEEVMAEKIRAVGGQRRFAVSRDLYDIYNLSKTGVEYSKVKSILPEKFTARGLRFSAIDIAAFKKRRLEFKADWDRRLSYLVLEGKASFEDAWNKVIEVLELF